MSSEDQLRSVKVPDVAPVELLSSIQGNFSMTSGDFVETYQNDTGNWNAIVSCFFLDTANNPLTYLETIYNALKPGGIWINIGPLLWHFENDPNKVSIELTFDELILIIKKIGFTIDYEHP
ncbi:hypothetical protein BB560_000990 [Smittium megazygosporum]|uniref:carnosine N-methyltransferase n=1 Tax=Smittium megazygosporum TaxID=133381 RepID=A0A2T9ZIR7_9FUNG|nr:hypothetical protein BB560_000990 [Smittium megazygosporum]